ncbi:MAG: hypothetical protein WCC94_12140 [Candidatus Bathyarchaeia archaeon]
MADVSGLPVDLACADGQKLDSTTLRISSEDHAILKTNLMRTKPFPAPLQFVAEPSWVFTSRKPLDLLFHSLLNFGTEMGFKSMDDMLSKMVSEVSKARSLEASQRFRAGLGRRRLSLTKVTASGETIRIELFRRWFENDKGHP